MSWGVVKLEKSLNFLSSLEWQLSLFLLMLGVRACCCCRRSSFLRSIEPLPYWCQLAFIQSRRAPFSSSCFSQHSQHSRARKEGRAASWISHVCVREFTYCEIEMEKEAEFSPQLLRGGRGESWKFQVGTLLSDAVLFHDSSSIPPYLLWPADRHS